MSRTAPVGLGMWIAYRPQDPVRDLLRCGASWVAPRAGRDGRNGKGCTDSDLLEYKRAGPRVYPWIYVTMSGWRQAVDGFARLLTTGACDGLIINAEAEWAGPDAARNDGQARALCAELRSRVGADTFLAHAPMDYVGNHPTFPWAAFGEACDAVMPQVYWYEHDDSGAVYHLERTDRQWRAWEAAHPQATRPRWPIGVTYRPAMRDQRLLSPISPGRIVDEVRAFLDHPLTQDRPASLYSIEAAMPGVLDAVRRHLRRDTDPAPPPPRVVAPPTLGVDRVRAVQLRLASLGLAPGPIDGIYGPRTTAAVRAFQSSRGLTVDGVVGPKTLAALGAAP